MISSVVELKHLVEKMITRMPGGKTTFFDADDFSWAAEVGAEYKIIVEELRRMLSAERQSRNSFQSLSSEMQFLTDQQWKTFFLYVHGHKIEENCRRCPETARIVRKVPGMVTAMFSILVPGKELAEHRGMYKGLLRYQLGLIVPLDKMKCGLRVGRDVRAWHEGQSLIFDGTHPHTAWNHASSLRAVLFVDFPRPLPPPLSLANRKMLKAIAATNVVTSAVERMRHPEIMVRAERSGV